MFELYEGFGFFFFLVESFNRYTWILSLEVFLIKQIFLEGKEKKNP